MISEHSDLFEMEAWPLHSSDSTPIKQHPYRTPIVQRDKIAQLIKQMAQQGIVKPSCSPWASPVVLVPKRDGSTRFCMDYRPLNPLVELDPESRAKTVFTSHCGLYEFTRMPFGLCDVPATFQRLMQVVYQG